MFTPVLRLGDLQIDILNRRVRAGDTELHLTSLEQSLLYLLAANAGRLLDSGRDPGPSLGRRLRGGEQHRRPAHPQPAHQAAEPFAATAVHRDGSRPRLPFRAARGGCASASAVAARAMTLVPRPVLR